MSCDKCPLVFKKKDETSHNEVCSGRKVDCEHCKCQFQPLLIKAHKKECPERDLACGKCDGVYKKKAEEEHDCVTYLLA